VGAGDGLSCGKRARVGDLFEYKLDRVTLKKNHRSRADRADGIEAAKVSHLERDDGIGPSLRGLWLRIQPADFSWRSVTVLENEVFCGRRFTDPIKPVRRRLISYARGSGRSSKQQRTANPTR